MTQGKSEHLIDRLRGALGKQAREGSLTCEEMRNLKKDATELARRLAVIRKRNPGAPAPTLSSHVYRMLKELTEDYRGGAPGMPDRKAANF